ncbi:hypothetical protein AB3K78_14585 [Leucobacter sp. HNU]|uniref:hypothetical protein n=1 Tax=Leucobacter sp. HNU TaxID=3236805 RepID=UPI003A80BBFC
MRERRGPFTALSTGLAIGDVEALHLLLTPDDALYCSGENTLERLGWEALEVSDLRIPVTRWMHPWIGDLVVPLVLAGIAWVVATPDPKAMFLEFRRQGETVRLELSSHHAVGYRRSDARYARRVFQEIVGTEELREQLRTPQKLV